MMSEKQIERPEQTDNKPPRQVTVQPQEPVPWKGGPPKQPHQADKGPRPVREGDQDKRNPKDRDGIR